MKIIALLFAPIGLIADIGNSGSGERQPERGNFLYRVVETAEAASLDQNGGKPTLGPMGPSYDLDRTPGKLFWGTLGQAEAYQVTAGSSWGPTEIWEWPNPNKVGYPFQVGVDGVPGRPVFVPTPQLPLLGPGRRLPGTQKGF